ncbi:MAG: ATP-binding protein, partial [Chloroflexi bacterium]|nr:ATP-binding protein [Chloroflexota bacterium]
MQHFDSYDPLTIEDEDHELIVAAKKREIRNILKSYTGYFDPFAEILQNAFDAVEKRAYDEDVEYLPEIWVTVNICENTISVTDNGCGMKFAEFQKFLKPNYSFKVGDKSRGMKGVGATYLAYGFNDLQVSTNVDGTKWSGRILRGREWAEDKSGTINIPMFSMSDAPSHEPFALLDRGTSVTIHLAGEKIRPKDLTWA